MQSKIQKEIGKDRRNKLITYVLVLSLMILFFLLLMIFSRNEIFDPSEEEKFQKLDMVGQYQIDEDTEWVQFQSLEELPRKFHKIKISGHFDREIERQDIVITMYGLRFSMDINGDKVLDFGKEGTYRFAHGPGFAMWYQNVSNLLDHPLTEADTVNIAVENVYYDTTPELGYRYLNKIKSGQDVVFFRWFRSKALDEVISVMIIMTAIVGFALSIVMFPNNRRQRYAGFAFSFFAITTGLYCLVKGAFEFMPLFVRNPVLCMYLDCFSVYFMVVGFVIYILFNLVGRRTTRIMYFFVWLLVSISIAAFFIQLTGTRDLYEMEFIIMIPGFLGILAGAVCLVADAMHYENGHSWLLLLILAPFILALCMTMIEPTDGSSFVRYGIFASAILHVVEMVRFYKEKKQREAERISIDKELAENRMLIMQSQIQPHFLYNSLSTIQILCEKEPGLAAEAVEHFSKYLRMNMDSLKRKECVPFEWELEHIKNYLFIEKLRFRDLLNIEYDIKTTDFSCPSLSIQPIVENAVKHGVGAKEEGGTITLATYEDAYFYHILITDDGVGFIPEERKEDERSHIGIENTAQRLYEMCRGSLEVESEIGIGTRVSIKIPKEKLDEYNHGR